MSQYSGYYKHFIRNAILQIFVIIFMICFLFVGCSKIPSEIDNISSMSYNIANTYNDCLEGYINYNVHSQKDGKPVITIWDSYKYGNIDDMKAILTYIINSPVGVEHELSENDLEYYVSEWYVLNMAHVWPLGAQKVIGGEEQDIVNRTTHANLNVDDEYAKTYTEIFKIFGKSI